MSGAQERLVAELDREVNYPGESSTSEAIVDFLLVHRQLVLEALGGEQHWNPEANAWHWAFPAAPIVGTEP